MKKRKNEKQFHHFLTKMRHSGEKNLILTRVLAMLLLCAMLFSLVGCNNEQKPEEKTYEEQGYKQVENGLELVCINSDDIQNGIYIIPSTVSGLPVIKIGNNAFSQQVNLKTVVIPEGIVEIGDTAFLGCSALETIVLPTSLSKIGVSAFADCTSLTSVVFEDSTNWKCSVEADGQTDELPSDALANEALVASMLTVEFSSFYWRKIESIPPTVENTTLIFQLTEDSCNGTLSSGAKRYLHGDTQDNEVIDQSIDTRNTLAEQSCNVTVTYDYWPDEKVYSYTETYVERIAKLLRTHSSTSPDMYSISINDMVGAMLRGCFANLLDDSKGENHFRFTKEDYTPLMADANGDDEGYMYEYMTSLTLSQDKMYLIASDYFLDATRPMYVVPVNLNLLVENASDVTGDVDGDGEKGTYLDLVNLVKNGEWTYELLKKYCDEVADDNGSGEYNLDGLLGFALSSNSDVSSMGILYSSPIRIFEQETISSKTVYYYPETNNQLTDFCERLATLMSSDGAYAHNGVLKDICDAFVDNRVLFGGVVCLGSLEDSSIQSMRANGDIGILPVPMYCDTYVDSYGVTHENDYRAQIHKAGRIGAISKRTTKFSLCTAFLNYQSTHSSDILDSYYQMILSNGEGEECTNVEMIRFIREHLGSGFDMTFENALPLYSESAYAIYGGWDRIIMKGSSPINVALKAPAFQIGSNIEKLYMAHYQEKYDAFGFYDIATGEPILGLVKAFEYGTPYDGVGEVS